MTVFRDAGDCPPEGAIRLWCEVFGDPPDDPDAFYSSPEPGRRILCAEEDGRVTGLLNLVRFEHGFTPGAAGGYVFALCTAPDRRGLGIARRLEQMACEGADYLFLIPGSVALRGFYRDIGYTVSLPGFAMTGRTPSGIPFDGDMNRLYRIYLDNTAPGEPIKPPGFFEYSLRGFAAQGNIFYTENGYTVTNGETTIETRGGSSAGSFVEVGMLKPLTDKVSGYLSSHPLPALGIFGQY